METVRSSEYTLKLAEVELHVTLEANLSRFPFIFFNLSGFSILHILRLGEKKRSSVDSYGMKHCVKLYTTTLTQCVPIFFFKVQQLSLSKGTFLGENPKTDS